MKTGDYMIHVSAQGHPAGCNSPPEDFLGKCAQLRPPTEAPSLSRDVNQFNLYLIGLHHSRKDIQSGRSVSAFSQFISFDFYLY